MAWTATLDSIAVDINGRTISVQVTVNGGMTPYSMNLNYGWDDPSFREGSIRDKVRKFIEDMKAAEATYNILKTYEGQEIPLGV